MKSITTVIKSKYQYTCDFCGEMTDKFVRFNTYAKRTHHSFTMCDRCRQRAGSELNGIVYPKEA